jgi:hypothetical protein
VAGLSARIPATSSTVAPFPRSSLASVWRNLCGCACSTLASRNTAARVRCAPLTRLSGRTMALCRLRMMLRFPSPSLKFRTVSFPQSGFKAGISDAAFPVPWFAIALRAFGHDRGFPALGRGSMRFPAPPCERLLPLYPRGPRSGPGYVVPVHLRLIDPIRPTRRHIPTSPLCDLYEMPSLCAYTTTPRQPPSGSVLSLAVLYRHVVP